MPATFSSLFIDDQYLKDYTPMGQNIDSLFIYGFVDEAQDVYIQDILGTPLYMNLAYNCYLGATYSLSTNPYLSSDDTVLIDLCSRCLAYWAVYDAIPHIAIPIRNVGLAQQTSDNTQPSTMEQMRYIREEIKNKAEFWSERIVRYLCNNQAKFPLYIHITGKTDMYPSGSQYDSDIYLGNYGDYGDYTEGERRFLEAYYRKA